MTENPVFETTRTLLAVREYKDEPVPDEVLKEIVESARLTASASNRQPWHFVLVTDRNRVKELGQLVQTGPYIAQAPAAVIAAYEKDNPLALSDVSRAIQSLMMTAWSHGVGSNWTGFAGRLEKVREWAGLPENYDVAGVIPLGYPRRKLGKGKKNRKPLAEVASKERFGNPLKR